MRSFETAFTGPMLKGYQAGVMSYTYKGVRCLKSPIDMAIYMRLIWDLKPRTLIEIGTHSGGSALLFADLLEMLGCGGAKILSIDLAIPEGVRDDRVRFLEGDVLRLGKTLTEGLCASLPHPWFVVEDSAHSYAGCTAALEFFSRHLESGDMLAIEDGVLDDLGMSRKYDGGPNRAIAEFQESRPGLFEIATEYCDMFGTNATYDPNGYLRKT